MSAPSIFLPTQFKIVTATKPVTTNGTVTFDNISMKNAVAVWLVAQFNQAASHATVITPKLGAVVATVTTAITFSADWWLNSDTDTTDTLVAQTAATTFTLATGTTPQLVVARFDPAQCYAQGATLDCIGATIATSSQATNYVDALWFVEEKYPQATPPAAIID